MKASIEGIRAAHRSRVEIRVLNVLISSVN